MKITTEYGKNNCIWSHGTKLKIVKLPNNDDKYFVLY